MIKNFSDAMNFIWSSAIYLFYPPLCPVCKEIVEERNKLCDSCMKKIFRFDTEELMPQFLSGVFHITKYNEGTRDLLHKLKFDNDLNALPPIKKILAAASANAELNNFIAQADVATFVPLHAERLKERGYNQTELIFDDFFAEKNLPVENFLVRIKSTPRLFNFNPTERKEIVQDAFEPAAPIDLHGKKILLADDIYTTGATTAECAKVLKNLGAEKIFVLAFSSN